MDTFVKNKLEIRAISKGYDGKEVLQKVDFDVKDGEFLSILGPSGCGKTTLLRILIGLMPAETGTILKDGKDITHARPDQRGMGIVFQNYALFENMSVIRNVEYALKIHGKSKNEARQIAKGMLEIVGLEEHADKMPRQLSGGQQQRVAIARTLALNPDVVLFDEPMSALDALTRMSMRTELKQLQKRFGMTMIYVTHDQEEAFALSDRIMVMEKGGISQLDTPEAICAAPANEYVRSFVLDTLQSKVESLSRFAADQKA